MRRSFIRNIASVVRIEAIGFAAILIITTLDEATLPGVFGLWGCALHVLIEWVQPNHE